MLVKKLWSKKNAVIFVWPGEEPLELQYDGTRIVVPPRDEIARVGQGSRYTHEAAIRAGVPVAGTAVIEDIVTLTPEGGYKTMLHIDHLCRYLTRDRDDLFHRGFNICETVDLIDEALMMGIPLYNESQIKRAREILAREMQRQQGYKNHGEVPPPSMSEHLISWAVKHLKRVGPQARAHKLEDIQAVLEGVEPSPAVATPPQAGAAVRMAQDTTGAIDREHLEEAQAVYMEANDLGVSLNNFELKALLSGSQETVAKVRVKIEAKKREAALRENVPASV